MWDQGLIYHICVNDIIFGLLQVSRVCAIFIADLILHLSGTKRVVAFCIQVFDMGKGAEDATVRDLAPQVLWTSSAKSKSRNGSSPLSPNMLTV